MDAHFISTLSSGCGIFVMTDAVAACRGTLQVLQNPALLCAHVSMAGIAQALQLPLQAFQCGNLRCRLPNVPVEQCVYFVTGPFRFSLKMLQGTHIVQRHAKRTAMSDKQ